MGLAIVSMCLVETEPLPMKRFLFPLDNRPTGERFGEKFLKFTPFPYERHDGQGFLREQEIDTEFVKTWHGNGGNGDNGARCGWRLSGRLEVASSRG